MNDQYKNSYKATAKELVSLSVYNVGYQLCDAGYQWGPGIRDHYLIHYVISGKGTYEVNNETHFLSAEDAFLVYPNTEIIYRADANANTRVEYVHASAITCVSPVNIRRNDGIMAEQSSASTRPWIKFNKSPTDADSSASFSSFAPR